MDMYWVTLLILLPSVLLLAGRSILIHLCKDFTTRWSHHRKGQSVQPVDEKLDTASDALLHNAEPPTPTRQPTSPFCIAFLTIYLLVMSSEWLSGPYLYPLLRHDRALPESIVCALYATAYTSAALSATVVGFLADRYGRRRACFVQCVVHIAACLTVIFGGTCLPVLFAGRALAGLGLTLLWTVFESWMVTEWNARGLGEEGLGPMFATMTTANCGTAIVGGVLGHCMVSVLGSKVWPFGTGIILEIVAAVLMLKTMNENYGFKQEDRTHKGVPEITISGPGRLGDKRIWALTLVTCCFEGTNFILIFFWPSVLQDAHKPETNDLPYGVIFATFMAAMIIGAQFFHATSSPRLTPRPDSLKTPVVLLLAAVLLAAVSLLLLAVFRRSGETPQYAVFLLFELANGVYIPSMAYIRGLVVDEQSRAGLYGLMRLPLFVFVILALGITAEDTRLRELIFGSASFCLLLAIVALLFGFRQTLHAPAETVIYGIHNDGEGFDDDLPQYCRDIPDIIVEDMEKCSLQLDRKGQSG